MAAVFLLNTLLIDMSHHHPLIISAPGKVILHGEHAVVYGKTALATSLDLRCYLILKKTEDKKVTLHLPEFIPNSSLREEWALEELKLLPGHKQQDQLLRKLADIGDHEALPSIPSMTKLVFLYLLIRIFEERIKDFSGLAATVISNLPAGSGLGSSAAYSVCLSAGFLTMCGLVSTPTENLTSMKTSPKEASTWKQIQALLETAAGIETSVGNWASSWKKKDLEVINKWGMEAEKLIHGTPSGIDNSISTFGGAISFKAGEITHLQRMPRIRILLINTRVPRSTKKMVAEVREKYNRFTSVVSPILEAIENISLTAQHLLLELGYAQQEKTKVEVKGIFSSLEELFSLNHHLLNTLGVGHPAIEKACGVAASLGLSAKLTGGGGGGCIVAILPPDAHFEFRSVFESAGFDCWETNIACNGVTSHSFLL